jgi:hypothetical protein
MLALLQELNPWAGRRERWRLRPVIPVLGRCSRLRPLVCRALCARRRFLSAEKGPIRKPTIRAQCRFRIEQEATMSPQPPDERPLWRPLFVILLCTGYVFVAFFFFFMFRTILLPEYFAR